MTKARDNANGGFGLVLMKPSSVVGGTDNGKGTVSFSAATSVSLNDVFSATYDSYKIIIEMTQSVAADCYLRMRTGGSTDSGSNYLYNTLRGFGTTLQTAAITSQDHFQVHYYSAIGATWAEITIHNPFKSSNTYYTTTWRSNQPALGLVAGIHNLTTSYESFELYMSGGTITGTVSVYGYNK